MFQHVVQEFLGVEVSFTIMPPEEIVDEDTGEVLDGNPRIVVRPGLTIELAPAELIVEGDDPVIAPLIALGVRLRRIYDLARRFPWGIALRDRSVTATLDVPSEGPAWRDDGLWTKISITGEDVEVFEDHLFVTKAALDAADFETHYWAFIARLRDLDGVAAVWPEELKFEASQRLPDDEAFPRLIVELGLTDEVGLRARVESALARSFATLEEVRARYTQVYKLRLPSGIAFAAALVELLGALPDEAPGSSYDWGDKEPGWRRGSRWLDEAVSMRSSGLLDWFAPGGLARPTVAIPRTFRDGPPPHEEGLLDPRLDMRYRCDAPQFVTFMSGNSDGDHWGLWYDSPQFYPCIARNYARDSAETWLANAATIPELLRSQVVSETEEALEKIRDNDDENAEDSFYMTRWRTLRIVDVIMTELERALAERTASEEARCPWPRSEHHPIGNPRLAFPPGSGDVPDSVPGYVFSSGAPSPAELEALIAEARKTLASGEPAFAYALGLYLHWRDDDELRVESAALLGGAYRAFGFTPFAEILDLHVRYRDMASVGVFAHP